MLNPQIGDMKIYIYIYIHTYINIKNMFSIKKSKWDSGYSPVLHMA